MPGATPLEREPPPQSEPLRARAPAALRPVLLTGLVAGGLAGGIAGLTTFLLWGHPWAWLGMALEGAAVGVLSRRLPPVRAVLLYWLFGLPYVVVAYALGPQVP